MTTNIAPLSRSESRLSARLTAMQDQLGAIQRDLGRIAVALGNLESDAINFECLISDRIDQIEHNMKDRDNAEWEASLTHRMAHDPWPTADDVPW